MQRWQESEEATRQAMAEAEAALARSQAAARGNRLPALNRAERRARPVPKKQPRGRRR